MQLAVAFALTRPETTDAVTRGAGRLFEALGYASLLEVRLPNGRRADLMGLGPKGEIVIAEVKSSLEDYRSDRKWGDYGAFCDAFYFAVPPEFPREVPAGGAGADHRRRLRRGGDPASAGERAGPARRKALTLAIARLAAFRAT
jgi:hypothetical protein